jgi:hypothetical protein
MLRGSTLSVRRCLGFTARDRFMHPVYKTGAVLKQSGCAFFRQCGSILEHKLAIGLVPKIGAKR